MEAISDEGPALSIAMEVTTYQCRLGGAMLLTLGVHEGRDAHRGCHGRGVVFREEGGRGAWRRDGIGVGTALWSIGASPVWSVMTLSSDSDGRLHVALKWRMRARQSRRCSFSKSGGVCGVEKSLAFLPTAS